ncbi:hypothetical protein [Pacificibacter marinus]|uniref:Uncharacterized protein n=1 Tax=Pacificibacter marinus TaxID=658057 RepID=A0A1Y5TNA6_9RHOB|nr:hypothetical protein [Pacificibacter marinus]SEL38820.1 hypothetical protein SAMN04488032_1236 [Pacificibacter marinus]SLN65882.1 hypothetical protein PAM7971_03474 [Pacificibacter marinus]
MDNEKLTRAEAQGVRYAAELEAHLRWLDSFSAAALGVLAVASGIYTYLGVTSLLDDNGALSFFAAISYSIAVSVGIFVFWSYLIRLLPAVRTVGARLGLFVAMLLGSAAIIAMSSWLNAAALAGAAAVEQHLATTVQDYQTALEQANEIAVSAQSLERDVSRVRQSFEDLSEQEATGDLSGLAGRGAVFRVLRQKSDELLGLETQIASQQPLVAAAFIEGNQILSHMRALTVEPGPIEVRSVQFSEEAVRLSGVITQLRQLSVAQLVNRAAEDLSASVVLPELDGRTVETRAGQQSTIRSVLQVLGQRAETLRRAADTVIAMPPPNEIIYTPISTADAVIRYAGNFAPSWAGAIAIDLLPAVLVFILAITHAAIRSGKSRVGIEDTMTISELRAALSAVTEMDGALRHAQGASDVSAIPQPQGTNGETAPSDQDKPADV